MTLWFVAGALSGLAVGLAVGVALHLARRTPAVAAAHAAEARLADARRTGDELGAQLAQSRRELADERAERARLDAVAGELQARWRQWESDRAADRDHLAGAFAEMSQRALQQNNEQFLALADATLRHTQQSAANELAQKHDAFTQMIEPLQALLERYQEGLRQMELERQGAYAALSTQVSTLGASQLELQRETRNLVTALRSPQVRGRWGEVQLRRVVELAGMVPHCDFTEQVTVEGERGRLRPDLVVHLPGDADVVVDAKVPLDAYLRAVEETDDAARRVQLAQHARQLRNHVDQLAKKEYWSQFDTTPEVVVAFVPGDALLTAALEHDPVLLEHALASRVLLATPTTLIALLQTFARGWRQEDLAANARLVQELGAELYERLRVLGGHLSKLQRNLTGSVEAYNEVVGSLESRVLVTARRFPDLGIGVGGKELGELSAVSAAPRLVAAPELAPAGPQDEGADPGVDGEGGAPAPPSVLRRVAGSS